MSRCVPSWDLDDNPANATNSRLSFRSPPSSAAPDTSILDYEVTELTWENGQLALHGLGLPRVQDKPSTSASPSKYVWDKPRSNGTLESIVNQATRSPNFDDKLVRWFDHQRMSTAAAAAAVSIGATMTTDALVPCSNVRSVEEESTRVMDTLPGAGLKSSTQVGSCSRSVDEEAFTAAKRTARRAAGSNRDQYTVSGSTTPGWDSQHVTRDSCDIALEVGFTSVSMGSPENTGSGKPCPKTTAANDHDSVCHSQSQRDVGDEQEKKKGAGKSSLSTKRSRAAAIHNRSERKRRDKINQRMKTLQKLVPNSSKTDKASMLDEVIEYLKQLQAQVNVMSRMNMPSMILPMAMQQQLQMSMMAPMGMGMGVNNMGRTPNMMPDPFMAMAASWDGVASNDSWSHAAMVPDPMAAFLACQSQPMTMDAYNRMAAWYQQLHRPPGSSSKSS